MEDKGAELTDAVTTEVRSLQTRIEALAGQEAPEDLVLSFHETPVATAGEKLKRTHRSLPQKLAGERLDDIKDQIRQEMEDVALLISAEGDQLTYEAGQATEILIARVAS